MSDTAIAALIAVVILAAGLVSGVIVVMRLPHARSLGLLLILLPLLLAAFVFFGGNKLPGR